MTTTVTKTLPTSSLYCLHFDGIVSTQVHVFDTELLSEKQVQDMGQNIDDLRSLGTRFFKGTAILLMLIHLFLSAPLITMPHPPLPSGFVLPSQNRRTAFQFSLLLSVPIMIFFMRPCTQVCQMVSLRIVLSKNVLHIISNFVLKKANFLLLPRMDVFCQCILFYPMF